MTNLQTVEQLNLAWVDLDKLVAGLMVATDLTERDMWLARIYSCRNHINHAIRLTMPEMAILDELKGYDC